MNKPVLTAKKGLIFYISFNQRKNFS